MTNTNNKVANYFPPETLEAQKAKLRESLSHIPPNDLDDVRMVAEALKPRRADEHDYQSVFIDWGKAGGHRRSKLKGIWDRAKPDPEALKEVLERQQSAAKDGLIFRSLGDVAMKSIEYIWPGWYAKGYLNLVAGESGAGKSTVVVDAVARVTTGAPFPGQPADAWREPGYVFWLGGEDGAAEMTVPRLNACGANLRNVFEIQGAIRNGQRATFSMQDDIAKVSTALQQAKESNAPITMLIIDPITSYLSGQYLRRVDLNDAGQVRTVLEPWFEVAQKYDIAIVGITHFMKDATRTMVNRVLGSAAFVQTCRSLIVVTDMQIEESPHLKAMLQVKTNLPERPEGAWIFYTEKVLVGTDAATKKQIHATRPRWERLDRLVTPATLIGKATGAKSEKPNLFIGWLRQQFAKLPKSEGLRASDLKAAAVGTHIVSEVWWDKHSGEYLDKKNIGGEWWCRPKE